MNTNPSPAERNTMFDRLMAALTPVGTLLGVWHDPDSRLGRTTSARFEDTFDRYIDALLGAFRGRGL